MNQPVRRSEHLCFMLADLPCFPPLFPQVGAKCEFRIVRIPGLHSGVVIGITPHRLCIQPDEFPNMILHTPENVEPVYIYHYDDWDSEADNHSQSDSYYRSLH